MRRLAAFAGGWTLEAAEPICAGDGSTATSRAICPRGTSTAPVRRD
jgi:hypothetical protein